MVGQGLRLHRPARDPVGEEMPGAAALLLLLFPLLLLLIPWPARLPSCLLFVGRTPSSAQTPLPQFPLQKAGSPWGADAVGLSVVHAADPPVRIMLRPFRPVLQVTCSSQGAGASTHPQAPEHPPAGGGHGAGAFWGTATAPLAATPACREQLTPAWPDASELVLLSPSPPSSRFPFQPHPSHLGGGGDLLEAGPTPVKHPFPPPPAA